MFFKYPVNKYFDRPIVGLPNVYIRQGIVLLHIQHVQKLLLKQGYFFMPLIYSLW